MKLEIEKSFDQTNRRWTIIPNGEIDVATVVVFRDLLDEAFQEHKGNFIIDLKDLCYMDSTGLGVIIGAYGRIKEKGFSLSVQNPRDNIMKLLRITNLDKILCPEHQA